jgi:hypothetical protein
MITKSDNTIIDRIANPDLVLAGLQIPLSEIFVLNVMIANSDNPIADRIANPDLVAAGLQIPLSKHNLTKILVFHLQ